MYENNLIHGLRQLTKYASKPFSMKWESISSRKFYKSTPLEIIGLMPSKDLPMYARVAQWVRSLDLTGHTSLSPIRHGFASSFVNYKKGCTRLAVASHKVYQLLAQGRWFSPGTPASSTTKTGRHDIAEILLKVALKNQKEKNKDQPMYVNGVKLIVYRLWIMIDWEVVYGL